MKNLFASLTLFRLPSRPYSMGDGLRYSPGQTSLDKERLLKKIEEEKLTIIFEHDPAIWGAQVK